MKNEDIIKGRVLGQYLGCKLKRGGLMTIELLYACKNAAWNNYDDIILRLKPLSDITDEDAKCLGNMDDVHFQYNIVGMWNVKTGDDGFIKLVKERLEEIAKIASAYQYLQLKGYDLPQYLLDGKTLEQVGLAIYEK